MANYLMTPDEFGSVVSTRCAGGTPVLVLGYYGLSAMEYFTR